LLLRYEEDLNSADFTLLGNLFFSEGKSSSKVLKVTTKTRTGTEGSIVTCMRKGLAEAFSVPVGMGGTFLQAAGTVKYHVMPEFSACPLDSDDKVNAWLRYFNFEAPFVNMATFISKVHYFLCFMFYSCLLGSRSRSASRAYTWLLDGKPNWRPLSLRRDT